MFSLHTPSKLAITQRPDRLEHKNFPVAARWVALAATLLLAACATPTTDMTPPATARHYHPAIDMAGRLTVRYQKNGQEQAVHGSFTWAQSPARTDITLLSPLGQTLATIATDASGATLMQSGHAARRATDVDALAAEALGWPLPVSGLRKWLQGYADGADAQPFIATPGNDSVTTRDGWRIRYVSWQNTDGSPPAIPKRIDMERDSAAAGTVALRVVIDAWQPR